MRPDSDRILVELVLSGDRLAFGALIDRHRAKSLEFAARIVGPAGAEDVVPGCVLAAFLGLHKLHDPDRVRAWLYGIVLNFCKTRLRLRSRGPIIDGFGGLDLGRLSLGEIEPSPNVIFETKQLHLRVLAAVDELPATQRDIVRSHYFDWLTLNDIAIINGSPIGTVKARLHHARSRLRAVLLGELGQFPRRERRGEFFMIDVSVHDVLLRAPKAGDAKWLAQGKDYKLGLMRVILLKERSGEHVLSDLGGSGRGRLHRDFAREALLRAANPMGFDDPLLDFGAMKIDRVAVSALRDNIYYATISVQSPGGSREMDARPSDAISIAPLTGAPIFVAPEAFKETEIENPTRAVPKVEEANNKAIAEGKLQPELTDSVEMEWRSFRSLPRDHPEWLKPSS
jgi:RNA polymerase sigma-70 factor (ECF subfamily)